MFSSLHCEEYRFDNKLETAALNSLPAKETAMSCWNKSSNLYLRATSMRRNVRFSRIRPINSHRAHEVVNKNLLINTSRAICIVPLVLSPSLFLSLSPSRFIRAPVRRPRASAFPLHRRVQPTDNASNYARPNATIINGDVCINRRSR